MINRLALLAATGVMAAACASAPAPLAGPSAPEPGSPLIAAPTAPAFTPTLNLSATSSWLSDERLLPQYPILALVDGGGAVGAPAGFSTTCNPDNGAMTARLGKQPATRVGQSATYQMRVGDKAQMIEGRFEAAPRSSDADFVFKLDSPGLRSIAAADQVTFQSDQGDLQWAFVKDPAARVDARYIAALRNIGPAAESYLVYCNPK
ncbi:MAG: hypothetical protein SGJ21_00585 [Alphaproteobacteria bacterium]|nr:hypothetical protein [Alphaproteobacteria bacterium]